MPAGSRWSASVSSWAVPFFEHKWQPAVIRQKLLRPRRSPKICYMRFFNNTAF
jgi:hypothetical protein